MVGDPRRQRVATSTGGYPDAPTATDGECRSCGASIPDGQTKYRFCLTNHLGGEATTTDESATTTFLGTVHLVVESTMFYGAVAKGGAAANLLTANEAAPAVNDYTLIYDLDETPAPQLADRWPSLPDAVQVDSAAGEQLLRAARDRTRERARSVGAPPAGPDAALRPAWERHSRRVGLRAVLNDADDEIWLVPAMALTETADEDESDSQQSSGSTTQQLDCQNCGQATDHRFKTHESIPDETWTGQPIWECQECGTARYGPALE